jgi:hypothetical protein
MLRVKKEAKIVLNKVYYYMSIHECEELHSNGLQQSTGHSEGVLCLISSLSVAARRYP